MGAAKRDLVERSLRFSGQLLRLVVAERRRGMVPLAMLDQLLRAGSAIGAHNAEAQSAITRRHLIALRAGALREAREAQYWLHLLAESGLCSVRDDIEALHGEATELVAILSTSVSRLRDLP